MNDSLRNIITWAAIGVRDAATLILQQMGKPDPDLAEVRRQVLRVNRAVDAILGAVDEGRRKKRATSWVALLPNVRAAHYMGDGGRMTRRACWTCEHLLTCRPIGRAHGTLYLEAMECDFEGEAVACSPSGVCGRWKAREEEEEEEEEG